MERNSCEINKSQHVPGEPEEKHRNLREEILLLETDINPKPTAHEIRLLTTRMRLAVEWYWKDWTYSGLDCHIVEVSGPNTIGHNPGRTFPNRRSVRQRGRHLHNTQQTQEANIHVLSRTQTRDTSNRNAADIRFGSHSHWVRHPAHFSLPYLT